MGVEGRGAGEGDMVREWLEWEGSLSLAERNA